MANDRYRRHAGTRLGHIEGPYDRRKNQSDRKFTKEAQSRIEKPKSHKEQLRDAIDQYRDRLFGKDGKLISPEEFQLALQDRKKVWLLLVDDPSRPLAIRDYLIAEANITDGDLGENGPIEAVCLTQDDAETLRTSKYSESNGEESDYDDMSGPDDFSVREDDDDAVL